VLDLSPSFYVHRKPSMRSLERGGCCPVGKRT